MGEDKQAGQGELIGVIGILAVVMVLWVGAVAFASSKDPDMAVTAKRGDEKTVYTYARNP